MSSLHENVLVKVALSAQDHAAGTVNGTEIDCEGYDEVTYVVNSATNGTGGTVDIKAQERADGGTWSDITGAALAQITEAEDNQPYLLVAPVSSAKPNQRLVATVGTATCDFGAEALLKEGNVIQPVTQDNDATVA